MRALRLLRDGGRPVPRLGRPPPPASRVIGVYSQRKSLAAVALAPAATTAMTAICHQKG